MKDVEALCDRAIVINKGTVIHDGPLAAIIDRFSRHKIIELQFSDNMVPARAGTFRDHPGISAP
jgi:ABC-2 type transport system ATP-binding protein